MKKACIFLDLTEWFTFVAKIWELENLVTSLPFYAWLNLSAAMSTTIFLWCGFLQFSTRQYRNIKVDIITSFKSNWINEPILYLHLAKSFSPIQTVQKILNLILRRVWEMAYYLSKMHPWIYLHMESEIWLLRLFFIPLFVPNFPYRLNKRGFA